MRQDKMRALAEAGNTADKQQFLSDIAGTMDEYNDFCKNTVNFICKKAQ